MRNTYFVTCPLCGSNLDPGERCDCEGGEKYVEVQNQTVSRRVQGLETEKSRKRLYMGRCKQIFPVTGRR